MLMRKISIPKLVFIILALLCVQFLWGCSTITVDDALVAKFQHPTTPGEQETMIYVIRTSSFVGAARNVWVSCNEQYKVKLSSGSFGYFKVPAGVNTINIEQSGIALGWCRVDNRAGETVFLKLDYTKGKLSEIPSDQGITLVMKYTEGSKYDGAQGCDQFKTGLLNPGFLDLDLMKTSDLNTAKDSTEEASITFIRNQTFAKEVPFGIWSESGWIGDLKGETYFEINVPPGQHFFFCSGGTLAALNANVEAGKRYFVQVEVSRGWHEPNIQFVKVENGSKNSSLSKWIDTSQNVSPNFAAMDNTIRARLDAGVPIVQEGVKKVQDGSLVATFIE